MVFYKVKIFRPKDIFGAGGYAGAQSPDDISPSNFNSSEFKKMLSWKMEKK